MKSLNLSAYLILFINFYNLSFAQTTNTLSGHVLDAETLLPLANVNITVMGTILGTATDKQGHFRITTEQDFPLLLKVSMMGYATQTVQVKKANSTGMRIALEAQILKMDEIVIGASRMEEKYLQSPVSIEKLDMLDFRETAAVNFYDALADVKGMQMNFISLAVKDFNLRGFTGTSGACILQIVDGMDNQFPTTNQPLGNAYGSDELDIETIEILRGAASALYGANALNGVIIQRTKNPFLYQGLSAQVKSGMTNQNAGGVYPYHEIGLRFAKALNEKFAFKLNLSALYGENWHAVDYSDHDTNPINSHVRGPSSPSYDGMNIYGDEVAATLDLDDISGSPDGTFGLIRVARTGYKEKDIMPSLVTFYRGDVTLDYKVTDKLEAVYTYKVGYTPGTPAIGARRAYAITGMQHQKFELNGNRFGLRAYTVTQPWGETYNSQTTAININNHWKSNTSWFTDYTSAYLEALGNGRSVAEAHRTARAEVDQGRLLPGTVAFQAVKDSIINDASKIRNRTGMINLEGIYRLYLSDFINVVTGGNIRRYKLDSGGTFFYDVNGSVFIREFGAFMIASAKMSHRLKLSGSLRYDKNENLQGMFTPRIATVYSLGRKRSHNFRASYQTGFKNPSSIDQYIYSNLGGTILLGGAKNCVESYSIDVSAPIETTISGRDIYSNSYTQNSVFTFLQSGNPQDLQILEIDYIQPLKIHTWEVGYKGLFADKLLFDINYYFNQHANFIGTTNAVTPLSGSVQDGTAVSDILGGHYLNHTLRANAQENVTSHGVECGCHLTLASGLRIGGNYAYTKLDLGEADPMFIPAFNTPEHRLNLYAAHRNIWDKMGFRIHYRWANSFNWNVNNYWVGRINSYGVFDAQVSFHVPQLNSQLKIGAANLLSREYQLGIGNGTIGGLYYVSLTFDKLLY